MTDRRSGRSITQLAITGLGAAALLAGCAQDAGVDPAPAFPPQRAASVDSDAGLLVRIPAVYPARAAARGLSGYCDMRFDVDTEGVPKNVEAIQCSDPVFRQPSIEAVGQWRFQPRLVDGVAVERSGFGTRVDYVFEN